MVCLQGTIPRTVSQANILGLHVLLRHTDGCNSYRYNASYITHTIVTITQTMLWCQSALLAGAVVLILGTWHMNVIHSASQALID
jgi:hypothetical protein